MDESQPLLGSPLVRQISEVRPPTVNDPEVDFDPFYDPDNPLDWKRGYKMAVVALLALMAGTVYDRRENIYWSSQRWLEI
jgi:flagellar basal body rod protein FlgC